MSAEYPTPNLEDRTAGTAGARPARSADSTIFTPRARVRSDEGSAAYSLRESNVAEELLQGMRRGAVPALPAGSLPLHLLIVEGDRSLRESLGEVGRHMGFVVQAYTIEGLPEELDGRACDLVLLDMTPTVDCLHALRRIRHAYPRVPILVTTAFATLQTAIEAMRLGASDFLTKPYSLDELSATLQLLAEQRSFDVEMRRVQQQMRTSPALKEMAAVSPAMGKLMGMVTRVAMSTHPVFIMGESGTGKERVARMLHAAAEAGRGEMATGGASLPFLHVECVSPAAAMLETELFGYVRNEGTAMREERTGLLTVEGGGTLFLDEIDALPMDLQAKLLRVLQAKRVRPAGSGMDRPVTVRIVASSSRDVPALVERGGFRKDLYFHLNVVTLRVPPLRQRKEDLPLLVAVFLERYSRERSFSFSLGPDAMRTLLSHDWPGNVRELQAVIERACTVSSGPVLHQADLPSQLQQAGVASSEEVIRVDHRVPQPMAAPVESVEVQSIAEMERRAILATLERLNGDKLMTAKLLGIGKTTLYRKLREYGIAE